jgi:1-acyl-sn-glycerol-3-phosphate acyltransferase
MIWLFIRICSFIIWLKGWELHTKLPPGLKKTVIIVAPHTSTWDFIVAMAVYRKLEFQINYLAKSELFKSRIMGPIMRKTGAIAVDRSRKGDLVADMKIRFEESDELYLALAPEGTRKFTEKWKTGFYQIAIAANVPVVFAYIDFKNKKAGFGPAYPLTGDMDKDFDVIRKFYKDVAHPKNPEKFNSDIR